MVVWHVGSVRLARYVVHALVLARVGAALGMLLSLLIVLLRLHCLGFFPA